MTLRDEIRLVALSLAAGLVVLAVGTTVESAIISALHPDGHELEWVSDVVAAAAVTALTYLWQHLRAARSRIVGLERASIAIDEQLRLAAEIQRNLLPALPGATRGYRWAARMVPAYRVGGDFYDFIVRPRDGSVLAMLGDVSGKGIPAALMLSSMKTLFRVHAATVDDPALLASRISAALLGETGGLPYATAILARFDAQPPRVTYVNAGHPAGLVLRDGALLPMDAGGPPLGLLAAASYEAGVIELRPGDLGVLVTDGVTEGLDARRRSLAEALARTNGASPDQVCATLVEAAHARADDASAPPPDDRTAFAFRVGAE